LGESAYLPFALGAWSTGDSMPNINRNNVNVNNSNVNRNNVNITVFAGRFFVFNRNPNLIGDKHYAQRICSNKR
jgi:hypothetical protein